MKDDPFIILCEELGLDYYKVAGMVHHITSYHSLAKAFDISNFEAERLWNAYWEQYNRS